MKKIFLSAAVLAMMASACQNEAVVGRNEMQQGGQLITLEVNKGMDSRTTLGTGNATWWSANDKIYVCGKGGRVAGEMKLKSGANSETAIFEGYIFGGKLTDLSTIVFPAPVNGKIDMGARADGELDAPMIGTISGGVVTALNNVGAVIAFKADGNYGVKAYVGNNNMGSGSYTFDPATGKLTYVPSEDVDALTPAYIPEGSELAYVPVATTLEANDGTNNAPLQNLNIDVVNTNGNLVSDATIGSVTPGAIFGDDANEDTGLDIDVWDGTADITWYNETDAEFEITTAEQLAGLAQLVNEKMETFEGKTISLNSNIDLSGLQWTPVGYTVSVSDANAANKWFKGKFEGNNNTIVNLKSETGACTGLFGAVREAKISNLKIDGADIDGHHWAAALIGYSHGSIITNCEVTNAEIDCTSSDDGGFDSKKERVWDGDKAGVLVGHMQYGNSSITESKVSYSVVRAGRDAGQVVGAAYKEYTIECDVEEVEVSANDSSTGENIKNEKVGRTLPNQK